MMRCLPWWYIKPSFIYNHIFIQLTECTVVKGMKTKDLSSYWDSLGRFSSACLCHFKHTIVYVFWSMWISQRISHLSLYLWCNISLRNPFSENKSRIDYIYHTISTAISLNKCCCNMNAFFSFDLFISRVATKLQSPYDLAKGGRAGVWISSLTR